MIAGADRLCRRSTRTRELTLLALLLAAPQRGRWELAQLLRLAPIIIHLCSTPPPRLSPALPVLAPTPASVYPSTAAGSAYHVSHSSTAKGKMTIEAYDFDIDAYCVVCDRAIPPASSSAAQTPPPSAGASSSSSGAAGPSKRRDSKSALSTSLRSSDGAASKPMRRGHSSKAVGTALKRNKSTTKFAAAHHHHRRPLPDRKSVSKPRSVGEIIEIIEIDPDDEEGSVVGDAHTALYCSDECRLIDEARNELTLLRMGSSSVSSFGAGSSLGAVGSLGAFSTAHASPPLPPLASADHRRRRSSGGSSLAADLAFSTLSPIPSAAAGAYDPTIPAFPFPSQSPTPLALDLGARRTSKSVGSYSYRPSLMDRVSSSDALAANGGVWLGPDKGFSRSHSAFGDESSHAAGESAWPMGSVAGMVQSPVPELLQSNLLRIRADLSTRRPLLFCAPSHAPAAAPSPRLSFASTERLDFWIRSCAAARSPGCRGASRVVHSVAAS